jgi:hypothetical protein
MVRKTAVGYKENQVKKRLRNSETEFSHYRVVATSHLRSCLMTLKTSSKED